MTGDLQGWLDAHLPAADLLAPRDIALYQRALTHGSTGEADYQRLEFLGDRVLGLAVAAMLYRRLPDEPEGRLSHRLNALVSGRSCAMVARGLDVGAQLRLGKQARDDGARESDNVLGDVMEALIGATFVEQGFAAASALVERLWSPLLDADSAAPRHPKSSLQEWCAATRRKPPEYAVTDRSGPPHALRFTVEVRVTGHPPVSATGASKQEAETAAATAFLAGQP